MKQETREKAEKFLNEFASQIKGAEVDKLCLKVTRDGITMHDVLDVREMQTGSEWHRRGTGKLLFNVKDGYYSVVKTYRERKDGSYNPELINAIEFKINSYMRSNSIRNARYSAIMQAEQALEDRGVASNHQLKAAVGLGLSATTPSIQVKLTVGLDNLDKVIALMEELDLA